MLFIASFILLCVISLLIPKETMPSEDARVILEHTHETYIAPTCFEQADASNFITESNLKEANELKYTVHDTCTENMFQNEKDSLFINILKKIGLVKSKWDE